MSDSTKLYVRNRRPNRVIVNYAGNRAILERRGNRADSVVLPGEAARAPEIARWLRTGVLERITEEEFNTLAARSIDVEPNAYLKRAPGRPIPLVAADGDGSGTKTQMTDAGIRQSGSPEVEWAGEVMTTGEEIESMPEVFDKTKMYPSKNR